MAKNAILVNLERCVGCWSCAMACKVGNGLRDDEYWVNVRTLGSGEGIDRPAGVWPNLTMGWMPVWTESCISCAPRTAKGKQPFCVYNCPTEALVYGEREVEAETERLAARGFRIFQLPSWEKSKGTMIYASKK